MSFEPYTDEMGDLFQQAWLETEPFMDLGAPDSNVEPPTVPEQTTVGLFVPDAQEPAPAFSPSTNALFVDPGMLTMSNADSNVPAGFQPADTGMTDLMNQDNSVIHSTEITQPDDLMNPDNRLNSFSSNSSSNDIGSDNSTSLNNTISPASSISLGNSVNPSSSLNPDNSVNPGNSINPDNSVNPGNSVNTDNSINPYNSVNPGNSINLNDSANTDNCINPDNSTNPGNSFNPDNSALDPAFCLHSAAVPQSGTNTPPGAPVYYSPPKIQLLQPNSWQLGPQSPWDSFTPQPPPVSSAGHRFESFYIKFDYRPLPPSPSLPQPKEAKMYVEKYTPHEPKWAYPIVLVHGDFHTGNIWTTKPDRGQGWAPFFINKGFTVYVVDLPACGRSMEFDRTVVKWSNYASCMAKLTRDNVEATRTAASTFQRWPDAHKHTQWPGTGLRDDQIFETYMASTVPLYFRRHERQAFGKEALTKLVHQIGPVILLGEGSGATLSWLAADALPDSVKAVLAVEPAGPPGGTTRALKDNMLVFTNQVRYFAQHRPYGLADIPLTFDPPVPEPVYDQHGVTQPPLNLFPSVVGPNNDVYLLQRCGMDLVQADTMGTVLPWDAWMEIPRKLVALGKVCQLVVTGDASHHTTCDAATVKFMQQAGVNVDHVKLGEVGIYGNGHLMFLEKNSDVVAQAVFNWIATKVPEVHRSVAATDGSSATQ